MLADVALVDILLFLRTFADRGWIEKRAVQYRIQ